MRQSPSSRALVLPVLIFAAALLSACQSPTESTETMDVDDFVDSSVTPSPATAAASTDGKTYRVVRGNNQPDDIYAYAYKTSFRVTVTINSNATDDDIDLEFPVEITAITAKVEQASGGIVTPSTGSDTEHYETVVSNTTSSKFGGTNTSVSFNEDIWYSLPSGGKECLVTVSVTFKDDDGQSFTKTIKVNVNP